MKTTKRIMAGELVRAFARYMPDAPRYCYHIRLFGKFFCSDDTADLADQVAAGFSKDELQELCLTIPEEEAYPCDED